MRERGKHVDRRAPQLAHLAPARHLAAEHPVAEVFENEKALVEVEGVDGRRRKAAFPQCPRHRHERRYILGEMHQRAIRLAVADRRSVRLARRVHQDGRAIRQHEPRIRARRGVALQIAGGCRGIRCPVEEARHPLETLQPRLPATMPREDDPAFIRRRRLVHGDVEPVRRKPACRALGPLDENRALGQRVVEAELVQLGRLEPIEIAMGEGEARRLVTLHQREGRARHFALAVEPRDERAGEGRLAGAERP